MPGDVTGSLVYDAKTSEFEFRPGPVFTNILLADEINRTPPKTQAALLEAMEERQVTVDGEPRKLPSPFVVAATQNPIEYEGTYPLPEAQLDRFLLKVTLDIPPRDAEIAVLARHAQGSTRVTWRRLVCVLWPGRRTCWPDRPRYDGSPYGMTCWPMWSTCAGRLGSRRRCSSGCRRVALLRCWRCPGRGPGCPGATT